MKHLLKRIIKATPLYPPVRTWVARRRHLGQLAAWERDGKPVPPPHAVKQRTLLSFSGRFGLKILVETGTYYGDMVEAMKDAFDRLYSIELSRELCEKARARFKEDAHVEIICGDSGVELGKVMGRLDQAALFWLDGHYSAGVTAKGAKGTPVCEELSCILAAPDRGHVIIIDDARCFGTECNYPSIQELSDFVLSRRPGMDIVVEDDSIRITPRK